MDKTFRQLTPFGKAVACASEAMQHSEEQKGTVALAVVCETCGPRILNRFGRVNISGDSRLLGVALADLMIADYRFREAVTHALLDYRAKVGRSLRGARS